MCIALFSFADHNLKVKKLTLHSSVLLNLKSTYDFLDLIVVFGNASSIIPVL